jgi:hypothetical protein
MKNLTLVVAVAALLLATASFVLGGPGQALGQFQAKPYPMPQPCNRILWDFDSGWVSINKGSGLSLTHNLGGEPGDYFVNIVGWDDADMGIHHGDYGSDGTIEKMFGLYWSKLTASSIYLWREGNDKRWDQVRVRILKNQ